MQKILIYTLILTFIFPVYCFANPQRALPTEQEILEKVLLIIEDGVAEQEEISSFLEKSTVDVTAVEICGYSVLIGLIILGLTQLDFSGSPLEIFLDLLILDIGIYWITILVMLSIEVGC